jgi:hypothetical protein
MAMKRFCGKGAVISCGAASIISVSKTAFEMTNERNGRGTFPKKLQTTVDAIHDASGMPGCGTKDISNRGSRGILSQIPENCSGLSAFV